MRPTSACACSSACSWVSFSFLTRRPNWACVTCVAFSRPWSTNFWSTSFSTTSTSAAASTWAISPPIVPAPTTAALNTNMAGETLRSLRRGGTADWPRGAPGRLQRGFLGRLGGEPLERAGERVVLRAADEDEVDEVAQRVPALELVIERQGEGGGAVVVRGGGEFGGLGADQLLLEHLGGERGRRFGVLDPLGHDPAAGRDRTPDDLRAGLRPALVDPVDVPEAVDEGGPAADVGPQLVGARGRQVDDRGAARA